MGVQLQPRKDQPGAFDCSTTLRLRARADAQVPSRTVDHARPDERARPGRRRGHATRYRSPRREDAAAATREAILSGARHLFLTRGYAATTVPEIARAARVATQTVYASTGGKAALFAELLQPAINDPTGATAMAAAPQAEDPEEVLALCATAALKPGISLIRAGDMLWFYFGPDAWYSLVGDRGWTFGQAEQWLLGIARRDLLTEPAS
jgi:AcrR family transcriptional regulator